MWVHPLADAGLVCPSLEYYAKARRAANLLTDKAEYFHRQDRDIRRRDVGGLQNSDDFGRDNGAADYLLYGKVPLGSGLGSSGRTLGQRRPNGSVSVAS